MTAQEVDRASGIATPSVRPQQRSIPSSPILSTPATFTSFDLKREKDRIPNEVAPFEEPNRITPNKINRYQPAVHADKSAGKSDLTLFFKSFKHLRVGKTKDSKRTMRSDVIPDQLTIRSQRDSIIEVGANAFPSDHIIDIMRTPPPSAPATSQTIPSAYPYPYLDQMLMRTQSAGAFSDQYTLGEQLSRPDTAAESGSESSHRNSTSTSSVYSNPNYPTNTVALELTSQASREWFPQRRRNSFWRTRPLPNLPNAINSLHTRGSSNSSMPL